MWGGSKGYGTEGSPLSIPRQGSEDSNFMRIDDTATLNCNHDRYLFIGILLLNFIVVHQI